MSLIATPYYKTTTSEENYSFQAVSRNENPISHLTSLLDWIKENEIICLESETVSIDSNRKFQEIRFSLTGKSAAYFPLLKGIAASGQPKSLRLQVNQSLKIFTLIFDTLDQSEAKIYLSKILTLIEKEVRFKQVLRKVILNQKKFKSEEKLLFNEMSK